MENEQIIIDKKDLDHILREGAYTWRRMLFDLEMENYAPLINVKRTKWKRKNVAIIDITEWDAYEQWVNDCLADLSEARDLIKTMQAVYDEYHDDYEKKHNVQLDDLIRMQLVSCDAEEFERVRDKYNDMRLGFEDENEPER